MSIEKLIEEEMEGAHFSLTPQQLSQFVVYLRELQRWNAKKNITALKGEGDVVRRLFVSSVNYAHLFDPHEKKVLDLGAGAGFPGLPIKILFPSVDLLLLDGIKKKVVFLKHVVRKLSLSGVSCCLGRAGESFVLSEGERGYDVVVTMGVATLDKLLGLSLPLLGKGGLLVVRKGGDVEKELEEAKGVPGWLFREQKEFGGKGVQPYCVVVMEKCFT